MWKSFVTSINKLSFYEVEESRKPFLNAKPIYRDELENKASKKKAEKKRDPSAHSKPKEDGKDFEKKSYGSSTSADKKEVITVKVRMTKQEAARMLSKCKDGGFLDFKDVAHELAHIPPDRVNIVSAEARNGQVLKSIPEEV
ncbi:uncharacterized protein LOC132176567 [Corylus avellana]|uniref:uncharacterized protein LOC132174393 n=1 Tax=Corylus avellana TaxID=13451 RepID=UPI001E208D7D|nr:uncharacterized protein LOC132174393 [Corylus avellana]XP_059444798.1 uncharacterized protein LOC132176567 [Corylus avellana]